jgi:hypothetical protein
MKTILTSAIVVLLLCSALAFESCKKKDDVDPVKQNIQRLVPQNVIDTLRIMGMDIVDSGKPIQIVGIYEIRPMVLLASSIPGDRAGVSYSPYRVRLFDQKDADQSIKADYVNADEKGTGLGGFVAGSGNKFSAFFEINGTIGASTFKMSVVYSGEWSSTGIKNMQYAFYMKEKNDSASRLVKVGTTRIFKDSDGLSSPLSALRLGVDENDLANPSAVLKSALTP